MFYLDQKALKYKIGSKINFEKIQNKKLGQSKKDYQIENYLKLYIKNFEH